MWRQLERICGYGFLVLLLIGAVWLAVPDVRSTREAARPSQCRSNLRQIGIALHNYRDQYGSFPPAFIADGHGRPMHSWRTLLLPFLDQRAVYEARVAVLECPSEPASLRGFTSFLAIVGPSAAWPGEQPAGHLEFPDGMESTILVAEVAKSGILWMEPRDLNFDEMSFRLNDAAGRSISSRHTKPGEGDRIRPWTKTVPYVNVLFADGAPKRIRGDTPPETIRVLLTTNGGEEVSLEGREP
jgi:hypothetical protein